MFGLWAVVAAGGDGRHTSGGRPRSHYFNDAVNYTEPLFVVVIMALASTRPIIALAEAALRPAGPARRLHARRRGGWSILTVGPLLGSFITEPAR